MLHKADEFFLPSAYICTICHAVVRPDERRTHVDTHVYGGELNLKPNKTRFEPPMYELVKKPVFNGVVTDKRFAVGRRRK